MKAIPAISILLLSVFILGCEKSEWLGDGDYFFLENKGAVMPVWVKGNRSSDVYILTVHGGPGATSGHEFPISQGFKHLEENYNLIYWDQRMSGLSQGDPDLSTLTIDQHIEDLERLVTLIQAKYNPGSLFILGHSWGGAMSAGYLGQGNHQININGWIDLDGALAEQIDVQAMKTWILDRVPLYYDRDPEFYQFIMDWYDENPYPVNTDPYPYLYSTNFGGDVYNYEHTLSLSPIPYSTLAFGSPFTWAFYWSQYGGESGKWVNGYDMRKEVSNITIPALLLWGAEDGIVPATIGQQAFDLLGTPTSEKKIVFLDECAHSPHYEKPLEFSSTIIDFVDHYK